ncbi:MAG: hypothetical protein ACPLQO_11385, partial [Desulfotomaculales bacterium]
EGKGGSRIMGIDGKKQKKTKRHLLPKKALLLQLLERGVDDIEVVVKALFPKYRKYKPANPYLSMRYTLDGFLAQARARDPNFNVRTRGAKIIRGG